MDKLKVKVSTIARIAALLVVLANQCLALFGREALPFTENMAYQVVSLLATVVMAIITCWKNQDVTEIALIAGKVFDALSDGEVTEEELETIVAAANSEEELANYKGNAFLIGFANGIIASLQKKKDKDKASDGTDSPEE